MQVFVYEHFTGGGASKQPNCHSESPLLAEAIAMVCAVAADFAVIPSLQVVTSRDSRLPPFHPPACHVALIDGPERHLDVIRRLAQESDWTLLIAPETDGTLWARVRLVESVGGQLLSPASS